MVDVPSWLSSFPVLGAIAVGTGIAIRVAALGIIPGNRKPSTGMSWLLLVLLSPAVGVVAFYLFGSTRLGTRRHQRQRRVVEAVARRTGDLEALGPVADPAGLDPLVRGVVTLNRSSGALPLSRGNEVVLLPDYRRTVVAMTEAVETAQRFVHVEFYIAAWDEVTEPFFDALVRATRRGVTVRLLLDHLGSRGIPGYRDLARRLDASGIEWRAMLPIQPLRRRWRRPDLRNHRKLVVVDGEVAFTGSMNLTEPGYNKPAHHAIGREWVELVVRVRGPVVAALEAVFAGDWFTETEQVVDVQPRSRPAVTTPGALADVRCQLVPSGPGYQAENNLRMFTTLIYGATRRLSLTSPYFVPDESLLYAVTTAARRGVEVELFVSEESDQFMVGHAQASYYRALLEAGVAIHLYPPPYILHSKHFTVDDTVAVVGSSNMDMRSFALNYELSLMLVGPEVVARFREVEDAYRAISPRLTLEEWSGRSPGQRYLDNVMRLTAALQ